MRTLLLLIGMLLWLSADAQRDSVIWNIRVKQLDNALLKKDSLILFRLLHKDLSFAHSNGWTQSRADVWSDFKSGKLTYTRLEADPITLQQYSKNRATITYKVRAAGKLGTKEFNLTLVVMQVWVKHKKVWKLYARQSAKIE